MNKIKSLLMTIIIIATIMASLITPALAATSNPSPGSSGYMVVPLTFSRTITATVTPIAFTVPYPARLVSVSAYVRDVDVADTNETYTVDIQEAGTTVLSATMAFTADGQTKTGTISDAAIADESAMTVVVTLGGTTPSLTDLTVMLVLKRL